METGSGGGGVAWRRSALSAGLYLVATPIGTARDITLRALDILASADVIAAEDTRTARRLMDLHGVPLAGRPLIAYHDHNGAEQRPKLLQRIANGQSVAYASEAGTPLVADPGFQLARAAAEAGLPVTSAPGPSAVLAAMAISGQPSDRFLFAGFPPSGGGAQRKWLAVLSDVPATLVVFESPKRVAKTLAAMADAWGAERPATLCRELTKRFEEARVGTLQSLASETGETTPRGEVVLVIGPPMPRQRDPEEIDSALRAALRESPVKTAAAEIAARFGLPRRDVYQRALALKET